MDQNDTAERTAEPESVELGRKIRMRRTIRGLSLQDVASEADISVSLLSQIERGISTPSLKSLGQICAALKMPVGWLFDLPKEEHDDVVVRAAARRSMNFGPLGMTKDLLSPDCVPGIQMLRIVVKPGGGTGPQPYNNPQGAKCGIVLSGKLGLEVDGREYELGAGDSFAFHATKLHRIWCAGTEPVELIWVVSPAVY
jgi:transcriptional regulator with XRE-family HTH domain